MKKTEIKQMLKFCNEMSKDDIINWVIETIKIYQIDSYLFFSVMLEQDHISDSPYNWTDYANKENDND
tara:strand:+ start:517 stop:720 length:204 start_codon:yes stop_codon:yes gene_type:complete